MSYLRDYHAKVIIRSKLNYFSLIKDKLDEKRIKLFRSTCFGRWLDLSFYDHEPHMIHYMLLKQVYVSASHYDLPIIYNVEDRHLHFGRPEFCLITGFRFGNVSFDKHRTGYCLFRNRVFPKLVDQKVRNLDLLGVIEDEELFGKLWDEDAVRVCLLLALEVIFMGRLLVQEVDDTLMRLIEDLGEWNAFPWGEHIWRHLYDEILNVIPNHRSAHIIGINKDYKYVPTYTLSGFVWAFKIWILESFERSMLWWNKVPEMIPRGVAWSKDAIFKSSDYRFLFGKDSNPFNDIKPTIAEQRSDWYILFTEFFLHYIPRTPPIRATNPCDEYLRKLGVARKRGKIERKDLPILHRNDSSIIEISLIQDGVITELNARVFKLESIIQVLARERIGAVGDKFDFTDDFSKLSAEFCDELKDDFLALFESINCTNGLEQVDVDSDDDIAREYIVQEELRLRLEEKERILLKEQKIMEEQKRLRLETEKMLNLEEEKRLRPKTEKMLQNKNDYNKKSREWIAHTKMIQGSGDVSAHYSGKTNRMTDNRRPLNVPDMTELLKNVKPWFEDLSRPTNSIDSVNFNYSYGRFLHQPGRLRCMFPWCDDVCVDRRFWQSLVCLDPTRQGWLMDEHIELWVNYMWHVRPNKADWAMVSSYFVQLLLQNSLPLWYANGERYAIPWCDVNQVFMPINQTESHWCLAQFHIGTGVVAFYDSGETSKPGCHDWYIKLQECLQVQLPVVLEKAQVFEKKGIDRSTYSITFSIAENVPKQGGVFGDCGIWVCIFLYRLAHGLSLVVNDPIQTTMAYRERMARFFFEHKVVVC